MDKLCLILSLLFNSAIIVIETFVLLKVAEKKNIFKFYTFLSNFIALVVGIVFVGAGFIALLSNSTVPIWMKGLRFSATHSLASTLLVFAAVLMPLYKNGTISNEIKLFDGIGEKNANLLLHYICPILSIVSFLLFERNPALYDSQWTLYAALPSIIYWALYLVLTTAHCWKEPYGLARNGKAKGKCFLVLIPVMSVGIDYLLWWFNTL